MNDVEAGPASADGPSMETSSGPSRKRLFVLPDWLSSRRLPQQTPAVPIPDNEENAESLSAKKFFYRDQPERYRQGWARIAAAQEAYENGAMYRKFGYLLRRCILDGQIKLVRLERHLFKMEHETPADTAPVPDDDQTSPNQLPTTVSDTLKEIASFLPTYHQLLTNEQTLKSFHEVNFREYSNMYDKIRRDQWLNEEEMAYLWHPDDFVITGADPLRLAFESFLYRLPRFAVKPLFEDRRIPKTPNAFFLMTSHVRVVYMAVFVLVYAILLLLPVGLIYLIRNLSRGAAVGIVVGFTVLFAAAMILHRGVKMQATLIGACAYAAVLVALLATLQGNTPS